jgi:hypothetical protein
MRLRAGAPSGDVARALRTRHAIAIGVCSAAALATPGCGDRQAQFQTLFASDYAPGRHTVSVLGVYKDGRLSSEAWEPIRARLTASLGASACATGYEGVLASQPALAGAIDDSARANGMGDELLTELAPAARGDLILVFTMSGRLPTTSPADSLGQPAPSMSRNAPRSMGRIPASGPSRHVEHDALELSVELFSVAQRRSVGMVALRYSGASVDDAVAKLDAKLAPAMTGSTCAGWSWDATVNEKRIRDLAAP